jgi:hypothetical protein
MARPLSPRLWQGSTVDDFTGAGDLNRNGWIPPFARIQFTLKNQDPFVQQKIFTGSITPTPRQCQKEDGNKQFLQGESFLSGIRVATFSKPVGGRAG